MISMFNNGIYGALNIYIEEYSMTWKDIHNTL